MEHARVARNSVLGVLGRMNVKARRFVDGDEPLVLVKDAEVHRAKLANRPGPGYLVGIVLLSIVSALIFSVAGARGVAAAPAAHPHPQGLAVLAGASGEKDEVNFFVEDLRSLARQLKARGWQVSAAAGSRDGLLPGSVRATNASIARVARRALGSAGSGDQVLLVFHSHGREAERDWGQRSHSLVSEDRDSSGFDPGFDLDTLEPDFARAARRGVRVGLVDLSCYSGHSLRLQGPACTIALAAPDYISLCSGRPEERLFASKFIALPPPGHAADLESQFLRSRIADHSTNLPQISSRATPAVEAWNAFLSTVDPLDVTEDIRELRSGSHAFAPKTLLEPVQALIRKDPALAPQERALRERLETALATRKKIDALLPELARDYDERTLEVSPPGRDPLKLSPGSLSELLEETPRTEGFTHVQLRLLDALKPLRASLRKQHAHALEAFQTRRIELDRLTQELARAAGALFDVERELYDAHAKRPEPRRNTGCAAFAL
jgi:hypothetical protein